ncbi:hypothetical protein LSAT2_023451 [Lamellibrachia satsuma]|nr:hypothetical protein LSAT2_023451 [Lamellibrachia satsuma]
MTKFWHPFFWDEDDTRYKFLAAVSSEPEVANSHDAAHAKCHVRKNIEDTKVDIIHQGDWKAFVDNSNKLNKSFQKEFSRTSTLESICKLLQALRNIQTH